MSQNNPVTPKPLYGVGPPGAALVPNIAGRFYFDKSTAPWTIYQFGPDGAWHVAGGSGGGGGAGPFPFFGTRGSSTLWKRPGLSIGGAGNNFTAWVNQSSGVSNASAADNPGSLPLVMQAANDYAGANTAVTALTKRLSVVEPWTLTVGFAAYGSSIRTYQYPIILQDSVTGKAIVYSWKWESGHSTPFIATMPNLALGAVQTEVDLSQNGAPVSDYFMWFQTILDGMGHLRFRFGPDGFIWHDVAVAGADGFLANIDTVGFGIERSFGDTSFSDAIIWDWEETSP